VLFFASFFTKILTKREGGKGLSEKNMTAFLCITSDEKTVKNQFAINKERKTPEISQFVVKKYIFDRHIVDFLKIT